MGKLSQQPKLFFLHIYKAGGTTLKEVIKRQYEDSAIFDYDEHKKSTFEVYDKLSTKQKCAIHMIMGHFSYGAHSRISEDARYFTFMRDPVERVVSDFYYLKSTSTTNHFKLINSNNLCLDDYVRMHQFRVDNLQTRMISGKMDIAPGKCTSDDVKLAISNIDRDFIFVGTIEKFNESLLLLAKKLNWRSGLWHIRYNQNIKRPRVSDLPKSTIQLIKEFNRFDIELFEYVKKSLKEQVKENSTFLKSRVKILEIHNVKYANSLGPHTGS